MFKFLVIIIRFPLWLFCHIFMAPRFRITLVPRSWRTAKANKSFDVKRRKAQRKADKEWNAGIDTNIRQARENMKLNISRGDTKGYRDYIKSQMSLKK